MKAAIASLSVLAATLAGCSNSPTSPTAPRTSLVAVTPQGGASGVSPTSSIVMAFSHAMASGMQVYADLHEGAVTGPVVPCTATWSSDSMTLTLTPSAPLKAATKYSIHVGGGMKDANGSVIDMAQFGPVIGGVWADGSMMTGSGMMNSGHDEMGPGWQGTNGMYGMVFGFTTT